MVSGEERFMLRLTGKGCVWTREVRESSVGSVEIKCMLWSSVWIVSLTICDLGCGGKGRHTWTQIKRKREGERQREAPGKFRRDRPTLYNNNKSSVSRWLYVSILVV